MRLSITARGAAIAVLVLLAACRPADETIASKDIKAWQAEAFVPGRVLAAQNRLTDPRPVVRPWWSVKREVGFRDAVGVAIEVDPRGRVVDARLRTDAHDRYALWAPGSAGRQALDQARALRFRPFTRDGRAVAARLQIWVPVVETVSPPPPTPVALPAGDLADAKIELTRSACYGTCPEYTVTLTGSGEVRWQGNLFVAVPGEVTARIDPTQVRALLAQARDIGFFGLKDVYRARVTDNPTYTVAITIGGRTKRVEDYVGAMAGMPPEVSRFEDAIDRAARTVRWIEGDEDTMPSLRASGWTFDTPRAAQVVACMARDETPANARTAIAQLLAAGAAPDFNEESDGYPVCGAAVISAARAGDRALYDLLVGAGALRAVDEGFLARLVTAAAVSGEPSVVEAVLRHNPPLNRRVKTDEGLPLIAAASAGRYLSDPDATATRAAGRRRIVALLLAKGADPRLADADGRTPLHVAADAELVRMLLAAGAPLEPRDSQGETPLLAALDEDVALALISAGSETGAKALHGETIADRARDYKWKRVQAVLAKQRAA